MQVILHATGHIHKHFFAVCKHILHLNSSWGRRCLTPDLVRAPRWGQHPPAESSVREGGRERETRRMFTVLCLYLGCCLGLSFSTYLFSFFTPCYQPNLNDLNSIWAQKHLSLPYLWIMERFSGIQNL